MDFYAPLQAAYPTMQQGDLLEGIPFVYFPLTNAKVLLASKRSTRRNLLPQSDNIEFVAAQVEYSWGIVLSQTCDVQSDPQTGFARKPILIARIKPIGHVYPKLKFDSPKNCVSSVKSLATAGSSPSTFYLPAFQVEAFTFERAVTNLLDVQRFDPKDLQALTRQIRLRLTQTALQALQERCAYSFGRFGTPDDLYYSAKEWAEIQRLEEERRRNQGSA